jgi:hypothetical protein
VERVVVGVGLGLVILFGLLLAASAWFSAAMGCPPGGVDSGAARSATLRLERAVGEVRGVVESEGDYSPEPCSDAARIDITVVRDAHPDRVEEAVRVAQAGLQAPDFADVTRVTLSVRLDERVGPAPEDGRFVTSGRAAVEDVVATARAWLELHRRYPGASVGDPLGIDRVGIPLTAPVDPEAVTGAFELMRELGLDGAGRRSPRWSLRLAPSAEHRRYGEGHSYEAQGELPPREAVAAMGAAAGWSADLGPDTVLESKAVWWADPDSPRPRLLVRVEVDLDRAGRSAGEVADELAAMLGATASPYELEVRSASSDTKVVRTSG